MERSALSESLSYLKSIRIGAAQNLMIGDPERVVDYECSANQIAEFIPYEEATKYYHTNHHLVNMYKNQLHQLI